MKIAVLLLTLVLATCSGYPAEESQSVVSVYTTQPTTAGTTAASLDVYHQIANNIAERITSPIYKFLGLNKTTTKTDDQIEPKKLSSWSNIELLDSPEEVTNSIQSVQPITNDIAVKDAEEAGAKRRSDRKPEKFTLYSSYLPSSQKLEETTTDSSTKSINDINVDNDDEPFEFDDVDEKPKGNDSVRGPFVYVLELLGSWIQLAWGALQALFTPRSRQ